MTIFLYGYLDTIFNTDQFDKDEFEDSTVYEIHSEDYKIIIVKLLTRINMSADLFHKLHSLFGVGYGDLGDTLRDYLSMKLDYDFSKYPTVPTL